MSFSYEKLTENCISHLLDANQHRGVYIDREFSVKKTRTGGNSIVPFTFHFSPPVIIPYAVLLAAEGFSQAELKYLTRHDSLKELERYMTHITPELKQKKTRSGVLH